jgi:hypothetical protein
MAKTIPVDIPANIASRLHYRTDFSSARQPLEAVAQRQETEWMVADSRNSQTVIGLYIRFGERVA